jgi:hypothetical protein
VPAVATAHEAVLNDDAPALRLALDDISEVLRTVSRGSLTLIDSRSRSATHVDPVVWAKTVAPLAVPFGQGVLGPSGTASPIFNLLDVFLGRRSHESQLGREMALHRRSYPVHWRGFLDAVERVSVSDYVAAHPGSGLATSLDDVRTAYAGSDGFLGHHRRKVYGYLAVALMVGRGVTVGGFSGSPRRARGTGSTRLSPSRGRSGRPGGPPSLRRVPVVRSCPRHGGPVPPTARERAVTVSDLATHNDAAHGWWISIGGRVHDVTEFVGRHPGGDAILRTYAGLDATARRRQVPALRRHASFRRTWRRRTAWR